MNPIKLTLFIIGALALLIAGVVIFEVVTIEGNQVGVKETWSEGVIDEPLQPKTYFLFPGFTQTVYKYDLGIQVYVMNDKDSESEYGEGRKADSYIVQSKDQQDMRISLQVQWKRLPDKVVALHKYARDQVEERVLRPALLNVVKNQATVRTALEAYAGEGLVKLQNDVLKELQSHPELNQYVRVETFVIEHIGLNQEYTDQIVARQVAVQKKLRADEETKAAFADAEKAKAVAQANYETVLVEAKRDKEKGILDAEKLAQQQILAATAAAKQVELQAGAEKNRNVLIAQGEAEKVILAANAEKNRNIAIANGDKEAGDLRAQAIIALGEAEAQAKKMQLLAYSVEGADSFVKIEISRNMSEAFKNIKGYLPSDMSINMLTDNFNKSVGLLVSPESK